MIAALRSQRHVGDAQRLLEAFKHDVEACGDTAQVGSKVITDDRERKALYKALAGSANLAVFQWLARVARCNGATALRAELEHIASDLAAECPDRLLRRTISESGEFAAFALALHHDDHEVPVEHARRSLRDLGCRISRQIRLWLHLDGARRGGR